MRPARARLLEKTRLLTPTPLMHFARSHLPDRIKAATDRELAEQQKLWPTADFAEGVKAAAERRPARFEGR